jgi:Flp pilus assembly protein TadG
MRLARSADRLTRLLRGFTRDRRAVSAVEFAIILPFMVVLYIGSVEVGNGFSVQFKVAETARTVTDLASQYTSLNSTTMSGILGASSTVIAPFSSTNLVVTVSELKVAANTTRGTVQWSCSLHGTKRTQGSNVTIPSNLQSPATDIYLVFGEVTYPFDPQLGIVLTGTINMYQTSYFYPRQVNSIAWTGNSC